jgi:hypothetical protein
MLKYYTGLQSVGFGQAFPDSRRITYLSASSPARPIASADKARETSPGWPSIESVILEHSV